MGKVLYLIDGHSHIFRAFHAIRGLTDPQGKATNAAFGFTRMLLKLIKEREPDYIAVTFDTPAPTFRHEEYTDYKANRAEMPEELGPQIPIVKEIVSAFNIPIFELDGYEADDIIGTIAGKASESGMEVVIMSSDKDLLQLVSANVNVLSTHKDNNILYDEKKVEERFGVPADKLTDLFGLAGDSSDNIPGVRGIGGKTASQLIREFGSIDNLLQNVDKVRGSKKQQSLRDEADQALLSKRLATICQDAPLEIDLERCRRKSPNNDQLIEIFKQLGFRSLMNELEMKKTEQSVSYHIVRTNGQLNGLLKTLRSAPLFVLDLETTSKEPMLADLVGIAVSVEPLEAFYIPVGHRQEVLEPDEAQLDREEVLSRFKPILEDKSIKKAGQNIKYEIIVLNQLGIKLHGVTFDTMVASYLLNPSSSSHSLDNLSLEYLGHRKIATEEVIGKGTKQTTMDSVPIAQVAQYACEDADITLRLMNALTPQLEEQDLRRLFEEVEMPLIEVLATMEQNGVCLDEAVFEDMSADLQRETEAVAADIYSMAGEEFNVNSPKQLARILFEKMELRALKKTRTGQASTDERTMEILARSEDVTESQRTFVRKILEYRTLSKLKSTYVDALPLMVNPRTGRVHTSFNQTVTATGRLSSSNPNLQNIPVRDAGREIRRGFVAPPDCALLGADYSQIELRILAHFSGDSQLMEAFRKGLDIHSETASKVYGGRAEDVTPEMRRQAKVVNFGIIYGLSPYGLSGELGISVSEAKEFIHNYFLLYPKVKEFLDGTIERAKTSGYVTTVLNRRRHIPDIKSSKRSVREFAERTAVNAPMQGSAADIIKVAMIRLEETFARKRLKTKMVLQVHDELLFEVPESEMEKTKPLVKDVMENAYRLNVPLKVDINVGKNWLEAH